MVQCNGLDGYILGLDTGAKVVCAGGTSAVAARRRWVASAARAARKVANASRLGVSRVDTAGGHSVHARARVSKPKGDNPRITDRVVSGST